MGGDENSILHLPPIHDVTVRSGGAGEGAWLRRAKDGQSEGLDCEFRAIDGPFIGRWFWNLFTVGGTTEGHVEAGKISA
jgi:hypothetical protein